MVIENCLRRSEEGDMKQILLMVLLGVICTVNYPLDCTIVNTSYKTDEHHRKVQVECAYEDGSHSLYFASINKSTNKGNVTKVDYLPSKTLTDSITITCQ
jgi:hypothetical protein